MELYRLISNLHLRTEPSATSASQGVFNLGTVVEGIGFNLEGTWLHIRITKSEGGFHEGWMSLKFLKRLAPAPLTWRLGINMREFAYYGSGARGVRFTHESLQDQQLEVCRNSGVKLIRFFASRLQFNTDQTIHFVDKALRKIAASGMQAIVCLEDSLIGAEQQMPGNDTFHGNPEGHLNVRYWHTQFYRQTYLPHIRKLVTKFSNHPAILMWELGNEFALHPQPPRKGDAEAFLTFVKEASREIKLLAPNHLVALGLITSHHVFSQRGDQAQRQDWARQLYSLAHVDAVGIHYYQDNFMSLKPFIEIDIQTATALGKPFYVGEVGARAKEVNRSQYFNDEISAWKSKGAFSVLPWQLDSSPQDVNIGDELGIARWRDSDYNDILNCFKTLA